MTATGVFNAQEVVVVRHGETEWSKERRHTGRTDLPLTEEGREQARRLAGLLGDRAFAAVFASPLQRALDTAHLAGFANPIIDADLLEWSYGEYEGLTSDEIRARRPGWVLWRDGCPGGETLAQVETRATRVVERVRAVDGDVLVFAHGHLLRVVATRWLDMPSVFGQHFFLAPASPGTLGYEHDWTALRMWNQPLPPS
jgi:broad specificity phosphatase PhoE